MYKKGPPLAFSPPPQLKSRTTVASKSFASLPSHLTYHIGSRSSTSSSPSSPKTTAPPHHHQAPRWTPKRAPTFSGLTKRTYARHGCSRAGLSPASAALTAPRLLSSTLSAAGRASPSSSLSGATGSTAAFTSNASKAELDEALRSARWVTPFVIRNNTISHRVASLDTRADGSIASEADNSLGRRSTSGTASARAILRQYSVTFTSPLSLLYRRFTSYHSSPPISMSPSHQHAYHRLYNTAQH